MAEGNHRGRSLLPSTPLLSSECREEFDRLLEALSQEVKPRGIMEEMLLIDIASHTWDVERMRGCKVGIISAEFRSALESILYRLMQRPGDSQSAMSDQATRAGAEKLAKAWFADQGAKKVVSKLLGQFQLDESAIEAGAIRRRAKDPEMADRMLASLESRRQKALGQIFEYRDFALRLRNASNRIIEGKALALEDSSGKRPRADA
jgi:hypothetical protein